MSRASGGGTILGGSYQLGNWDAEVDVGLAERIMQRVVKLHPEIAGGEGVKGLSVVRMGVGRRPWRKGGVRLEREKLRVGGGGEGKEVWCVHNYGHDGYGYQTSYACAGEVVGLVEDALNEVELAKGFKGKL